MVGLTVAPCHRPRDLDGAAPSPRAPRRSRLLVRDPVSDQWHGLGRRARRRSARRTVPRIQRLLRERLRPVSGSGDGGRHHPHEHGRRGHRRARALQADRPQGRQHPERRAASDQDTAGVAVAVAGADALVGLLRPRQRTRLRPGVGQVRRAELRGHRARRHRRAAYVALLRRSRAGWPTTSVRSPA